MKFIISTDPPDKCYFGGYVPRSHGWKYVGSNEIYKFISLKKARRCIKFHAVHYQNDIRTYCIKVEK